MRLPAAVSDVLRAILDQISRGGTANRLIERRCSGDKSGQVGVFPGIESRATAPAHLIDFRNWPRRYATDAGREMLPDFQVVRSEMQIIAQIPNADAAAKRAG